MSDKLMTRDPFEDFFRGFFVRPVEVGGGAELPQMRVDVKEKQDGYQVHAELPGVKKEDIHVHIEGPMVSISAERKQESEVRNGERLLRTERHFGKVSRSFQLEYDVDESKAVARFDNGVLELDLPKKTGTQARRLTIE